MIARKNRNSLVIFVHVLCTIAVCPLNNHLFDWYMEKKCADRRLLIEHRHQREGLEGLLCCCEFYEGPCVIFKIRGNGAIDSEDLEFFMKICQEFKYEKVMEAQDSF